VDVAAFIPPPLLSQLRVTLGRAHRLHVATSWEALDTITRRARVDVLVVDPTAEGTPSGVGAVVELSARHPSVPIVPYVALSPESLRAVVALARQGVEQVVLHRFDDEPTRFRELLERRAGNALTEALLTALGEPLARLPLPLAAAVRQMFRQPHRVWTAQDLASSAGMPRRTMYRQLEAAGFASPRLLVQGARLLRAYLYLRDSGNLVEDVMVKLQYGSSHVLGRHTRETFGVTPSALRRDVDGPAVVGRRAQRLQAG
jgi:AraC-like DNA-binding protein